MELTKIRIDHPLREQHPDGKGFGFVVQDGSEHSENPLHVVKNGVCPNCEKEAPSYEPPIFDAKYRDQFASMREQLDKLGMETSDDLIHAAIYKRTGGHFVECECGTGFFVRA